VQEKLPGPGIDRVVARSSLAGGGERRAGEHGQQREGGWEREREEKYVRKKAAIPEEKGQAEGIGAGRAPRSPGLQRLRLKRKRRMAPHPTYGRIEPFSNLKNTVI
jgi:hypothetical protein